MENGNTLANTLNQSAFNDSRSIPLSESDSTENNSNTAFRPIDHNALNGQPFTGAENDVERLKSWSANSGLTGRIPQEQRDEFRHESEGDLTQTPSYNFKSSGTKTRRDENLLTDVTNNILDEIQFIGIKTPLEKEDAHPFVFRMHTEIQDQVQDNLRNLLLTNKGERLGRYNYGASLREITYEMLSNVNFESILMNRIKDAVSEFMPYVDLESFTSQKIDIKQQEAGSSITKVVVSVDYSVPNIGAVSKRLQLNLFVGG